MLNIKDFLSSGETTVYTERPTLMRKATAALVAVLAFNAIAAPLAPVAHATSLPQSYELVNPSSPSPLVTMHVQADGSEVTYDADAHTLLYQGLIDPSLSKVRAVSIDSQYLNQFMSNLPDQIAELKPGTGFTDVTLDQSNPETFRAEFHTAAPTGMALSFHKKDQPTYCFVRSIGISTAYSTDAPGAPAVDRPDRLYVASAGQQEAYTMIHELTHCAPQQIDLKAGSGPLAHQFEAAFYEFRSDLAVVLYGASKTGSFAEGMAAVGAFRGDISERPDHATVGMLESQLKHLNAHDFIGKPAHELIDAAVKITDKLTPKQVDELKLAYAKDAFTQRTLLGQGPGGERVRTAGPAYARLAGESFSVNLDDYGQRMVSYGLANAEMNAPSVKASGKFSAERAQEYAARIGVTLSADQLARVESLSKDSHAAGAGVQHANPFDLRDLEQDARHALEQAPAGGLEVAKEKSLVDQFNDLLDASNASGAKNTPSQRQQQLKALMNAVEHFTLPKHLPSGKHSALKL